jgi:hypothetical protein
MKSSFTALLAHAAPSHHATIYQKNLGWCVKDAGKHATIVGGKNE